MRFLNIVGAKCVSFDNQTVNPKFYICSLIKSIAISNSFAWENIFCKDTSCHKGCLPLGIKVEFWSWPEFLRLLRGFHLALMSKLVSV